MPFLSYCNQKFNFQIVILFFLFVSTLSSAPLRNIPQTVVQPDGVVLNLFASGDEFHNWLHDKDDYTIIQNSEGYYVYAELLDGKVVPSNYIVGKVNPIELSIPKNVNISYEEYLERRKAFFLDTPENITSAPSHGIINNIVIFIRFSDETQYTGQLSLYENMFNLTGTNQNSMYNYFKEVSYNKLEVISHFYPIQSGSAIVSYQDNFPRTYYIPYSTSNPNGYMNDNQRRDREHILLKKASESVASQIPQSLIIDGDNDGYVDNVCFIISGGTTAWATLLWPHRWVLYSQSAFIHGKRVWDYNFNIQASLQQSGVGVLCHEMYHSLGAPDLYHYTDNGISPVGRWDIMEQDLNPPQHMSAFMKYRYGGWITEIPEITTSGTYQINPLIKSTNNAFKLKSPKSNSEYFVIEYRKRIAPFESSLPGDGLLVFRINTARDGQGNAQGPPDEVYLFRPGGSPTANGSVNSANFNAAHGRTTFNYSTNPYPFLSNGTAGGIDLYNIGFADSVITFSVNIVNTLITLSPNGNEYLKIGETKQITWQNFGSASNVKIAYSIDEGLNWTLIANQINANVGSYNWVIPNTPSYRCKLRISDTNNPAFYDESDGLFAILPDNNYNISLINSVSTSDARSVTIKDNFAYVADGTNGIKIYEISQSSMNLLGQLQTPGSARKIVLKDNLAFITTYNKGIRVVDISSPQNPVEVGFHSTTGYPTDLAISGNYAFVAAGYKGIRVLDISNISAITESHSYITPGIAAAIAIKDNIAFVANEDKGVRILNISSPLSISEISSINPPGIESDIKIMDTLLYVASKNGGIHIVSVANIQQPYILGSYIVYGTAHSLDIMKDFAYVASGDNGVRMIDVTDPTKPIEIGFYDTPGTTLSVTSNQNYIFIADNGTGVALVRNDLLTSIDDKGITALPSHFTLLQNYPNPFNPETKIRFSIPKIDEEMTPVTLKIYDILGNEISTLLNEVKSAGIYEINFNATGLSSGVYFYRLKAGSFSDTKKMILMR